ncbi:hypothetical protein Poli38472_002658 [Pythium oligandrum]|uniref:t-SNARE coiled-coil homology domain-containing protein n=1 Tax=Pythium oligandrum TaxID=41045 RepID=A0A8K1CK49_PYTOL|nr:hypothetical protein Poli38472_002658 [Pythium oligandrum]|eukprot:TMW63717.1 hypothetical protein Poli38472_002658 [Pythium oligandrum]
MATTPTRATENVAASGDPYYVFKDELESKVSSVHQKYVKWKSVFDAKDSVTMKELPALTTQITTAIASAEKSVKFLEQTIVMVEANRAKFEHIDNAEIASRKAFVSSTRMEILAVSSEVTSEEAKARIMKVEQKALKPLAPAPSSDPSRYENHNARFLAEETARQNDIMRDQDKNIDTLHKTVGRLNDVAVTINDEVKTQNGMLKDLSDEVDTAQEQMNFVMDKMSKLLKTKDKCQLGLIVFLSFVLAVMLFLVIYT